MTPAAPLVAQGRPASAGRAAGPLVRDEAAALAALAAGTPGVLVRSDCGPEDGAAIRAAAAVVTVRGGQTSDAAILARGLGKPCVVACAALADLAAGRTFAAGAWLEVDGGQGQVIVHPARPA